MLPSPPSVQRTSIWPADFCSPPADGYLAPLDNDDEPNRLSKSSDEPQTPLKVPKKIPKRIIQNAAGIAVFTCMRSGLWMTGSGGSGILIARKSDGTWSPPSGIMLHTPTLSFIIGVDVYDCVLIINSLAALESISQPRVTLGEDVGLAGGALVSLEEPDADLNVKELGNTVMTYMKARGQAQRVNLHGCILTERSNENERFYGSALPPMDILSGNVTRHVEEIQPLLEVIKLAEGRIDFDASLVAKIAREPAPGDAVIASPSSTPASPRHPASPRGQKFGLPSSDDPDPFGILALEMAGLEIREAGSRLRPASSQIDFHSRPMSQLSRIKRQSGDTYVSRSNRESYLSTRTVKSQLTDACTQTDSPETSPSPGRSEDGRVRSSFDNIKAVGERYEEEEIDYTTVDLTALKHLSQPNRSQETLADSAKAGIGRDASHLGPPSRYDDTDKASKASSIYGSTYGDDGDDDSRDQAKRSDAKDLKASKSADEDADDEDDESDLSDDEEPVVFEVATVQARSTSSMGSRVVHAKGNVVTIPKRLPPPLPARNPARASLASKSDLGDTSSLHSPLRQAFSEADLNSPEDGPGHEAGKTDEVRSQTPPPNGLRTDVPRIEEPELNTPKESTAAAVKAIDDEFVKETRPEDIELPRSSIDSEPAKVAIESTKGDAPKSVSPDEVAEYSDSNKKGRLSVDTRATDDRSSLEESSYTTPTSERRFSFPNGAGENGDGKKEGDNAAKDDDTPTKPPRRSSLRGRLANANVTEASNEVATTDAPATIAHNGTTNGV